ncbi:MAG: hypothetical protein LBO73_00490 [Holosporaceae bacterium]|jgi:hypothetical protein|nr:hypothetical protein [Holosporaceae bacterium]
MYISDQSGTEFFLEKLSNCSFWDALRILNCKKKILSERERAFLVPKDRWNFWGKSDFYLQKISLPRNLPKGEVFLAENIAAEFCNDVSRIEENTRWIYAADHGAGNRRIIAGIGRGIMISRFLPQDSDVSEEVAKTAMYLRRFGDVGNIKIFSPSDGIKIPPGTGLEKIRFPDKCGDIKKIMADFVRTDRRVKPVVIYKNYFGILGNSGFFYCIPLIMLGILLWLEESISENKKIISSFEKSLRVVGENFTLEINEENFPAAKRFVDALKNCHDPTKLFLKASEILNGCDSAAGQALLEGNRLRVRTSLNKATAARLKNSGAAEVKIISESEYEELGAEGKTEVELCIGR